MKRFISFLLLLMLSTTTFSQKIINKDSSPTKPDYLKRSKNQQKIATILLLSGPVLIVAPLLIASGLKNGGDAAYYAMAAGFLTFPASITMFIIASGNQKKAMQFSLKNETATQFMGNGFVNKVVPSLSLKINL